jgi:hypothetical protein
MLVGHHRDDIQDGVVGLFVGRIGHAEIDLDMFGETLRARWLAGIIRGRRHQIGLPAIRQALGIDADLLRLDHARLRDRGCGRFWRAAVSEQQPLGAASRLQCEIARAIRPARGYGAQQLKVGRVERRLTAIRHRRRAELDGQAVLLRIRTREVVAVGFAG